MNPIQYFKIAHISSKLMCVALLGACIWLDGPLWGAVRFTVAGAIGWYGTWGVLVLLEKKHKK